MHDTLLNRHDARGLAMFQLASAQLSRRKARGRAQTYTTQIDPRTHTPPARTHEHTSCCCCAPAGIGMSMLQDTATTWQGPMCNMCCAWHTQLVRYPSASVRGCDPQHWPGSSVRLPAWTAHLYKPILCCTS